jgi:CheY-like chemotaxis protein
MAKKLLLADDSVTIQKVIELTFADEDIEVIAVSNGAQAISVAGVERPDIVLADVGMPERDGYEVAAFIKRTPQLSHIPVLLLTGAFEPIDEGRAKSAGCDGVLVKPFEPQMVINRVKDLIAGKRPVAVPGPQPGPVPVTPPDEYFNRLGAALGAREPEKPREPVPPPPDLAAELAQWRPAAAPSTPAPAPAAPAPAPSAIAPAPPAPAPAPSAIAPAPPAPAPAPPAIAPAPPSSVPAPSAIAPAPPAIAPTLAEAFAALLAAEQGKVAAPQTIDQAALRDDVVEEVTKRVVERMTDTAVRDIVSQVAERLVRDEIARIKGQAR